MDLGCVLDRVGQISPLQRLRYRNTYRNEALRKKLKIDRKWNYVLLLGDPRYVSCQAKLNTLLLF